MSVRLSERAGTEQMKLLAYPSQGTLALAFQAHSPLGRQTFKEIIQLHMKCWGAQRKEKSTGLGEETQGSYFEENSKSFLEKRHCK